MKKIILFLCLFFANSVYGFDFSFHGGYKFGGTYLKRPSEDGTSLTKSYLLHNLILSPEIVAYDDINIFTRFSIFNSSYSEYLGGAVLGDNKIGNFQYQMPSGIYASLAYLSWTREYGNLFLGRIPLNFGLGLNLSDKGNSYLDNLDGVAVKAILGSFTIMPAYGVLTSDGAKIEASEYLIDILYEISEITIGANYHKKFAHSEGMAIGGLYASPTSTPKGNANMSSVGVYVEKDYKKLNLKSELSFQSGNTGLTVNDSADETISLDAFAIALELSLDKILLSNKLGFGLDTGYISGDDPNTPNVYEGFLADRDYDVSLILFNQPLTSDFLGTRRFFERDNLELDNALDIEFLTNAFYISGKANYQLTEKINLNTNVILARILNGTENNVASNKYGVEIDLGGTYKINDITNLMLDFGYLFPGELTSSRAIAFEANIKFLF